MASSVIQSSTVDESRDAASVVRTYQVDLGVNVENEVTALTMARSLGPNPLPSIRQFLTGTELWCDNVHGERTKERRDHWMFTATFGRLPKGEDEEQQNENPLLRPPVYGVRYFDQEYVVKEARNLEALGVEFANGAPYRAANTLGAIVNGAGRRPDEPIVRTERIGVITIAKNRSNLGQIMDLNENYRRTCNSDSINIGSKTFVARRLKYEVTEDGGRQVENGVVFYPTMTEISIHKSTDLKFDNVGFEHYTLTGGLTRALDKDREPTAEPVNLELSGRKLDSSEPVQITYRDLEEVAYATEFFS